MNRSRAIASSLAATGVLVSLTVAGVAVVNATDADVPTESATLVVDSEPLAAPSFAAQPLPDVTVAPLAAPPSPSAVTSDATTPQTASSSISRSEARSLVLAQAPGEIVKTWSAVRDGYRAYAVKVLRPDGSLATGFVDRASGVVFDWTTVAAPAPSAQSGDDEDDDAYGGKDDDDHGSQSDDHESESHDEDDD